MYSPTAHPIAMEESSSEYSPHSGRSPKSTRKTPSKTRQKLVELMLKNLELTLEDGMSDSSDSSSEIEEPYDETFDEKMNDSGLASPVPRANKKTRTTATEMFYSNLNDKLSGSPEVGPMVSDDEDEKEIPLRGVATSKEERMGNLLKRQNPPRKQKGAGSNYDESMHSGGTLTQGSSYMSGSDTQLSITDIKKYVLNSLSKDVREQIPESAWKQIINSIDEDAEEDQSAATTKSTKHAFNQLMADAKMKDVPATPEADEYQYEDEEETDGVTIDIQGDDFSVFSEITTHTMAINRENQHRSEFAKSLEENYAALENKPLPPPRRDISKKPFGYPAAGWAAPAPLTPMAPLVEVPQATPPPERPAVKLNVSFSTVSVRYYKRILDLNPSVTSGPAIGIGWIYRGCKPVPVDDWEKERAAALSLRQKPADLILNRQEREMILKDLGYTQNDIAKAVRLIRKAKDARRTTVDNLNVQGLEESMEKASKMVKGILRVGKKKGVLKKTRR